MHLKNNLKKYIDAGYPIIYINSFEEVKTDGIIQEAMGGREGLEVCEAEVVNVRSASSWKMR